MASDRTKISKVFVDSSVLIAAAISSTGSARDLIKKSIRSELKIIVSDLVLEETEKNLAKKAPKALPALRFFLEILSPETVSPNKSLVLKTAKIVDVKDAPIVAGAVLSKADYLVTFDRRHLLQYKREIEKSLKVKVVTPDEIIK